MKRNLKFNMSVFAVVWVAEIGKYDFRKILARGENGTEETQKYARYVARIMTDSHTWKNPEGKHISVLLDFDGLQLAQYATLPGMFSSQSSTILTVNKPINTVTLTLDFFVRTYFLQQCTNDMFVYNDFTAIRFLLHLGREFLPLLESHIEQAVVINGES